MNQEKPFTREFYDDLAKTGLFKNFGELVLFIKDPNFIYNLGDILAKEEDKNGYVRGKLNNISNFSYIVSRHGDGHQLVINFFYLFVDIKFSRFIHVINEIPDKMVSYKTYRAIMSNLNLSNKYNAYNPKYMLPTPTLYLLDNRDITLASETFSKPLQDESQRIAVYNWIVHHSYHHISQILFLHHYQLINPEYFSQLKIFTLQDYNRDPYSAFTQFLRVFLDSDIVLLANVIDKIGDMEVRGGFIWCFVDNPCWKHFFNSINSKQVSLPDNHGPISSSPTQLISTQLISAQLISAQPNKLIANRSTNQKDFFEQWLKSNNRATRYSIDINTCGYNEIIFEKTNNPQTLIHHDFCGGKLVEEYFGSSFAEWIIVWISIDIMTEFLTDLSSSLI